MVLFGESTKEHPTRESWCVALSHSSEWLSPRTLMGHRSQAMAMLQKAGPPDSTGSRRPGEVTQSRDSGRGPRPWSLWSSATEQEPRWSEAPSRARGSQAGVAWCPGRVCRDQGTHQCLGSTATRARSASPARHHQPVGLHRASNTSPCRMSGHIKCKSLERLTLSGFI